MVKIVASDIDGTLLRSDGTVSERTRRAVAAVEESGVTFVLVTGRPPRWLAPVRDQLGHRGVAICANGALVLDLHTDEVVTVDAFEPDVGRSVLDALRDLADDLNFGVEWPDGFGHGRGYPRGIRQSELVRDVVFEIDDDEEFFSRPVIKVLVRGDGQVVDELASRAVEVTDGMATVTWSSTGLLEISASGVTKASALERLAGQHGATSEDVVAFGDMPNDLAMLEWVGRGIAVANAHPLVLDVADETTASNDDDGVAQVLESLVTPP
ncbi:HAD family hydrolase [Euzebya sp.]|uniref:HAD family hydrolase n=1 Tax=Euzebya sp. TaxID=1971409 RepID=UPI003518A93F